MSIVQWDGSQALGVDIIDKQHKHLYEVINSLHNKLHAPHADKSSLVTTVDSMRQYVRFHFTTEEELLKRYGWPNLEEHKQLHREFALKADELLIKAETDLNRALREALVFLVGWLVNHIEGQDQMYGPFLRDKMGEAARA
ncbi:MAG: bacteriohemerythrin [Desulfovibrionaceae bacterium]